MCAENKAVSEWFRDMREAIRAKASKSDQIQHLRGKGFRVVRPYLFDKTRMERC